jgi:uncharacterized protein YkwD
MRGTLRVAVLAALLAVAVLLTGTGAASAVGRTASVAPAPVHARKSLDEIRAMDPADYARSVLRIINQKRAARDLPALRLNTCTDRLAERWGSYLATNLEFYHQDLSPFFKRCDAQYAGETLARGAVSPQEMVRLWMNSDGHRHILLSKYPNRIGLGAYLDSRGDWLVAADFTQI